MNIYYAKMKDDLTISKTERKEYFREKNEQEQAGMKEYQISVTNSDK